MVLGDSMQFALQFYWQYLQVQSLMQIFLLAVWKDPCMEFCECRSYVMICGMHCQVCLTIWKFWKTLYGIVWIHNADLMSSICGVHCQVFLAILYLRENFLWHQVILFFPVLMSLHMILWGAVWDFLSQREWAFHGSFQKSLTIVHRGRRLTVWNVHHNCKPSTQMCQSKLSTNDLLGLLTQSIVSSDYNLSGKELSITTEVESGRKSLALWTRDLSRDVLPPSTTVSIARSSNELTLTRVSPSVEEYLGTAELLSGMLPETSLSSSSACGDLESSCRCGRAGKEALGWKLLICDDCSRSCRCRRLLWPTAGWALIMRLVLGTITIMALLSFASRVGLCRLKLGVACPGNGASEKSRSGNTEQRQWGHCTLSRSHSSIHAEWKLWAHGRPRTCHVQTQLGVLLVFWDFSLSFYKVATNCHHKATAKSWLHAFPTPPSNPLIPLFYDFISSTPASLTSTHVLASFYFQSSELRHRPLCLLQTHPNRLGMHWTDSRHSWDEILVVVVWPSPPSPSAVKIFEK